MVPDTCRHGRPLVAGVPCPACEADAEARALAEAASFEDEFADVTDPWDEIAPVPAARPEPAPGLASVGAVRPTSEPLTPRIEPAAGGSFSERYRGTEWDQSAAPPHKAREAAGSRNPAIVIAIAGAIVLALLAAVGVMMLGQRPPTPTIPAGARYEAPPESTAPERSRGPVTRTSVVESFVERVGGDDATFSVDFSAGFTATEYSGYEVLSLSGSMDIRGRDFSGTWRVHSQNRNAQVGMIVIGEDIFVRLPEEDWQCVSDLGPQGEVSPFAVVGSADDVRYEGIRTEGGHRLHRLRLTGGTALAPWMAEDEILNSAEVRSVVYDVFVTDDGMPIRAEFLARIRIPDGLTKTELKIDAEYRFRGVGEEKAISAPVASCSEGPPA